MTTFYLWRRGGRCARLPHWVMNKTKRQHVIIIYLFLTFIHRYNAVRGRRAGSINSGVEDYPKKKTNKTVDSTHHSWNKSYRYTYLRQKIKRWYRMRYISNAKRAATFVFSLCQRTWIAGICMSYLSYPERWQVIASLLHCNALSPCRGFVTTDLVCISLGGRVGTGAGCAGCQRVQRSA